MLAKLCRRTTNAADITICSRESLRCPRPLRLTTYRKHCAVNPSPGQLILPEALKLLPRPLTSSEIPTWILFRIYQARRYKYVYASLKDPDADACYRRLHFETNVVFPQSSKITGGVGFIIQAAEGESQKKTLCWYFFSCKREVISTPPQIPSPYCQVVYSIV